MHLHLEAVTAFHRSQCLVHNQSGRNDRHPQEPPRKKNTTACQLRRIRTCQASVGLPSYQSLAARNQKAKKRRVGLEKDAGPPHPGARALRLAFQRIGMETSSNVRPTETVKQENHESDCQTEPEKASKWKKAENPTLRCLRIHDSGFPNAAFNPKKPGATRRASRRPQEQGHRLTANPSGLENEKPKAKKASNSLQNKRSKGNSTKRLKTWATQTLPVTQECDNMHTRLGQRLQEWMSANGNC